MQHKKLIPPRVCLKFCSSVGSNTNRNADEAISSAICITTEVKGEWSHVIRLPIIGQARMWTLWDAHQSTNRPSGSEFTVGTGEHFVSDTLLFRGIWMANIGAPVCSLGKPLVKTENLCQRITPRSMTRREASPSRGRKSITVFLHIITLTLTPTLTQGVRDVRATGVHTFP